ncbi:YacL family protein [Pseudoalteromonas fenneropenaei]|uniref:YacL family protein n=1 Tax=Pseudoalteromonas fenneropenaei TaxID=1737459 RepID=A0ABV7CK09_9GAMM
MEYQFIKDPLFGIRVRMSDEHSLIGRWLSDEIGNARLAEVFAWIAKIKQGQDTVVDAGREVRLTLNRDEALFEAHALFFNDDSQLDEYRDDALNFADEGLHAACGFEDFCALLEDFQQFCQGR